MSKFCLRTMASIERPAIAAIWPTLRGESVVLDVGATIGADAQQLIDFAMMGAAMARALFDIERPTVGLLNVGVEEIKGQEEVKEAGRVLREAGLSSMDYRGFVEGDDIGKGTVDVVVTEGFAGNIALKTAEGTARQIAEYLRAAMSRTLDGAGSAISSRKGAFDRLREKLDVRKSNGGVFLGLNGIVVKSHGGTDAEGFAAAIELGYDMVRNRLLDRRSRPISTVSIHASRLRRQRRPIRRATPSRIGELTVIRSVVRGIGSALPSRIMKNTDFEGIVETSDEWIVQRTGIRQRHIAGDDETTASLGEAAARAALDNAGLTPADIDLIVLATSTPDHTFPATAVEIQQRLGMRHGFAFDMQAVCSGFVYAVNNADLLYPRRHGQARAGDRRGNVFAHPRLERPLDLRPVRRRRRRGGARGRARARARSPTAACWPPACAPTASTRTSSMSMAGRRRPARSAICAWKAARSSSTPSA